MKTVPLAELSKPQDWVRFADEMILKCTYTGVHLDHCAFEGVRMKDVEFGGGSILHSRFRDAYIKNALFRHVDLTGTVFEGCNMSRAKLQGCKLWYVEFHRCDLPYDEILSNLPAEAGIRRRLLTSLRLNATEMGDSPRANAILLLELAEERRELLEIVFCRASYYRDKYKGGDRIKATLQFLGHGIQYFAWGYGLKLRSLFLTAALCIFLFAIAYWAWDTRVIPGENVRLGFFDALYISAQAFISSGSVGNMAQSWPERAVIWLEGASGVVFIGFLAAAVYRRLAR